MFIKLRSTLSILITATLAFTGLAHANEHDPNAKDHGGEIFHAFTLEISGGKDKDSETITEWELDGWIGTDENKLWLKSEGERENTHTESAEFWALYSRNVDTFWDAQIGIRHDTQPVSQSYLVAGVEGLAPQFLETQAHLFVSEEEDISARFKLDIEFLLTQRFILEPHIEVNLFAQDVPEQDVASGISDIEAGLQARYQITPDFGIFANLAYERKVGDTAALARNSGESEDNIITSIGIRLLF